MARCLWCFFFSLLLTAFSLPAEEEGDPQREETEEGDLLEQLLNQIDTLPAELLEPGKIVLVDAEKDQLSLSLPGGGELVSSDELTLDGPEDFVDEPEGYLINFNNLSVVEVIRFVSQISGRNFIFNERELDFTVTIVSEEPTSVQNIIAALLQVLKINNLQLIEQGNNFLIHRNPNVQHPSKIVEGDDEQWTLREEAAVVTRVFRLERVSASSLSPIIRSMVSADALVEALAETNHLVITDLSSNITRIASFIRSVDGPGAQLEIGQYLARRTSMLPLIDLAENILRPLAQNDPLHFIPHKVTESIFIISTPYMVERSMSVLQLLDMTDSESRILAPKDLIYDPELRNGVEPDHDKKRWAATLPPNDIRNTRFEFYKLQFRSSATVQRALEAISDNLTFRSKLNQDILSAIESVQTIEESNMLVYTGTVAALEVIDDFIAKIDTPLRQVFIEMLILDTSIDKSLDFGVEWGARYSGSPDSAGAIAFLGPGSPLPGALGSLDPPAGGGPATPDGSRLANANGFAVGALGKVLTHRGDAFTSMAGLLKALQTDSDTNVVMNPKLITEDNTPAEVFVGINTRFQTESISNESGELVTTNFEFRDVGSTLRVTPLLGDSNVVTLIIEQELSRAIQTPNGNGGETQEAQQPGPTTSQIRTTTRVHVPDKMFLVMSGMISEERTRTKTAVPCLGGLPIAGAAFARNNYRGEKRNLMIFIRPQIVDTEAEIVQVTKGQRSLFENKSEPRKKWKFEVDTGLDILNLKRTNLMDKDWGS